MKGCNQMQDHKKQDSLYVDKVIDPNETKTVSRVKTGNAGKDAFCVYNHERHAVGSKIEDINEGESVCGKDGSWHNTKK